MTPAWHKTRRKAANYEQNIIDMVKNNIKEITGGEAR
jgi:hypothetical protein